VRGAVRSPSYDAVHTRTVLFVDDAYWIVEDVLAAESEHRYDLRFHLEAGPVHVDATRVTTPVLVLEISGAEAIAIEDGCVSQSYGIRAPAPVVSATLVGRDARFVTLLAPAQARVTLDAIAHGSVVVATERGRDVVSWSAGDASLRQETRR
jgi:hypothetical protein